MADVRALLRNERASRQINHPQATYSTKGTLICLVCSLQLKSDSLWAGHLRSPQHQMKAQRLKDSEPAESTTGAETEQISSHGGTMKRRRAEDEDDSMSTDAKRKKSGSGALPAGFFDEPAQDHGEVDKESPVLAGQETELVSRPSSPYKALPLPSKPVVTVNEDEWAAFEAEIAQADVEPPAFDDAVISAKAMTAEELAAKARTEQSTQRETKEAEMAAEKEDAVRKLEDEFEEMAAMESKLEKLKQKREAIRAKDVNIMTAPIRPSVVNAAEDEDPSDTDSEEDDEDDGVGFFHARV